MRGRLQSCRRSQATRNRLDPWSLPLASLSPSGEPSLAAYSPPAAQTSRRQMQPPVLVPDQSGCFNMTDIESRLPLRVQTDDRLWRDAGSLSDLAKL